MRLSSEIRYAEDSTYRGEIVDMREFIPSTLRGEPPIDVTSIDFGLPPIEPKSMTLEERVEALEQFATDHA